MKKKLTKLAVLVVILILLPLTKNFAQQNQYIIDLDGTESFFVNDDASNHLDVSNAYTFECWICLKSYQQYDRIMDRRYVFSFDIIAPKGSGDYGIRFSERDNSDNILRSIETNEASEDLYLNTWYHVAVTFDGSDCRLYVNDNMVGLYSSSLWSLSSAATAINIGGRYWGGYGYQIDACIDEVRVSNIARAIGDMQTTTSSPEYSSDGNTVLLMHLDDQADPPSYVSGTGLTGSNGDDDITIDDYVAWNNCCGGNDLSLPVELSSFTALSGDGAVTLRWETASEINNEGFVIQRSATVDGDYQEITSYVYNSQLRGAGSSSHSHSYEFVDYTVMNDHSYWYKLIDVDVNGNRTEHGPIFAHPTAQNSGLETATGKALPEHFALNQNYPNPFNPETHIPFEIPESETGIHQVQVSIYDMNGKKIRTLFDGQLAAGKYTLLWNGKNGAGQEMASGIYYVELKTSSFIAHKKMTLLR